MKSIISVFMAFILFSIPPVNAQQDTSLLRTYKRLPILGGMRYMHTDQVRDPFIDTYLRIRLGTGEAFQLKSYIKNLNGEIIDTLAGDLAFISGEFEFQYAVNDWLAFFLGYGGASRLGSNAYTILTSGISFTSGFTLGGKARIFEKNNMLLSGSVDYASTEVTLFSIYDFVKRAAEEGEITDSTTMSLTHLETLSKMFINLNYAYSINNYIGLEAVLGWGFGERFFSDTKGNLRAGLVAEMDFDNFRPLSFPVGVLLGVKYNTFPESGDNAGDLVTYIFSISYTGHKDLDLSLQNIYQRLDSFDSGEAVKGILSSFKIQYYF